MTETVIIFAGMPLAAYVIGATPFGLLMGKLKGVDIRSLGSGNVGATNVGRVLGARWGYLCFLLDVAKGFVPVLLAGFYIRSADGLIPPADRQAAWLIVAIAAILGHVLPFWLGFKGGKGVATGLGAVCGVWPYLTQAGLAALAIWIIVTLLSRYVSLGSIVAAAAFPVMFLVLNLIRLGDWQQVLRLWPMGVFAIVLPAVVIVRHRSNIRRLLAGTENKIGRRRAEESQISASAQ